MLHCCVCFIRDFIRKRCADDSEQNLDELIVTMTCRDGCSWNLMSSFFILRVHIFDGSDRNEIKSKRSAG